jgi:hypothetical protein
MSLSQTQARGEGVNTNSKFDKVVCGGEGSIIYTLVLLSTKYIVLVLTSPFKKYLKPRPGHTL